MDAIRSPDGDLIGIAKVTRDITERRHAQDQINARERQFRLLVNGVTDYALFMLDPNGIVSSWNVGAEHVKGYTADEIIGQHFSRFYTATDRAAGIPTRALFTASSEGRFEAEGWRVRKDGSLFWANVVIDPIFDDRVSPSAIPRSRATSPNAATRKEPCRKRRRSLPRCKRWRRSGSSPAASHVILIIC